MSAGNFKRFGIAKMGFGAIPSVESKTLYIWNRGIIVKNICKIRVESRWNRIKFMLDSTLDSTAQKSAQKFLQIFQKIFIF